MTDANVARVALAVAAAVAIVLVVVLVHRPAYAHACEQTTGVYVGRDGRAVPLPFDPACGSMPSSQGAGEYGP